MAAFAPATGSSVALIDWRAFSGLGSVVLAAVLLVAAAGCVLLGRKNGVRVPRPGRAGKVIIVLAWILSILLVLPLFKEVATRTGQSAFGTGPVLPITLASAVGAFVAVAYLTRGGGLAPALGNGFAAAVAGPMVFELPFILIITPNVTTKVPHPLLLFTFFLLVILTTLCLPLFSTRFSPNRYSLYLLGAMLAVFGLWALATGYSPPGDPVSFTLNAVSKVLGFAAVSAGFVGNPAVEPEPLGYSTPGQAL